MFVRLVGAAALAGVGFVVATLTTSDLSRAGQPVDACTFITAEAFAAAVSRPSYTQPSATSLAGGTGSVCDYDYGQVVIFSGTGARASWDSIIAKYGMTGTARTPAGELGEGAYTFVFTAENQYQDSGVFAVFEKGTILAAISVNVANGEQPESVRPVAIAMAKLVAGSLP